MKNRFDTQLLIEGHDLDEDDPYYIPHFNNLSENFGLK